MSSKPINRQAENDASDSRLTARRKKDDLIELNEKTKLLEEFIERCKTN